MTHSKKKTPKSLPLVSSMVEGMRASHGLSAIQLAERIGISSPTYSRRVEGGEWTLKELQRVADYMGKKLVVSFEERK